MAMFELASRVASKDLLQAPPAGEELWALAASSDLSPEATARLDDAIHWAMEPVRPGDEPTDAQLLACMMAMALADGRVTEAELRVLSRTLLLRGHRAADDFALVQRALVTLARAIERDGLGVVLDRAAAGIDTKALRTTALRHASLVVTADDVLALEEPAALRRLGFALDATEEELADAIVGAYLAGGVA